MRVKRIALFVSMTQFAFLSLFDLSLVWARGGGGCFTPDTPILLADGSSKPISKIVRGDRVRAFTDSGNQVEAAVIETFSFEADEYYRVQTESGIVLRVTAEIGRAHV